MINSNHGFRSALKLINYFFLLLMIAIAASAQAAAQSAQPYFTDPAMSPDGSEIAFTSGGDIWAVPAGGGDAHLLVSHPATESRPIYSPDGRKLAFTSRPPAKGASNF